MHAYNIRSLTIKAGKDAVCGGLSAAGRGRPPACSNEVTLCGSSMTSTEAGEPVEGRVKACA